MFVYLYHTREWMKVVDENHTCYVGKAVDGVVTYVIKEGALTSE